MPDVRPQAESLNPLNQYGGSSSSTGAVPGVAPIKHIVNCDVDGERVDVKCKSRPYKPTKAEIDEHESSHYPYRNWC